MDVATLGIRIDASGATNDLRAFGAEAERTAAKSAVLETVVKRAAGAFAAWKVVEHAQEVLGLGARYQTLGVVMNVVGANAGKSAAEMAGFQAGLQKTGISMIESRNNLARMAQAHLDLAQSQKLARVAQDAAVIGNLNSSDAFERLIHGIEAAEPMILRSIGINVGFEESYVKAAHAIGKNREELTEHEKTQIRANAVIESGTRIAGTYEAAMGTAGKQIKSTERYLEDVKVKVSEAFQPQFTAAVFAYANALKFAVEHADTIAQAIKGLLVVVEVGAIAFGSRWVNSILASNAAMIAMRTQVLAGNAVMLDSVQAQRGAAASAVQRAEAQRAASASTVTALQAERAAITEVQLAERQRLATSAARVNQAVPMGQLAPLGGAVVARDNAAVVFAMKERAAAQATLIAMSQRAAASDLELAAAANTLALAEARVAEAEAARGVVMARTTLVARAATAATGALSGAMALLGGPIGVAILAAIAINAALDHYLDSSLKAAEQTEAQSAATDEALRKAHARAAAEKKEADQITETQRKFAALKEERTQELDKLTALNAAHDQSTSALKALEIRYDAMIQKAKDAKEHKGKELVALNALTDGIARQKIAAEELAAAQQRHDQIRDTGHSTDSAIRTAEQELSLVGQTAEAAERKRIQYDAVNRTMEAQFTLSKSLEHADANQAAAALDIYDNTLLAIRAATDLAQAQRDVRDSQATDAIHEQRDAYELETKALLSGALARKGYKIDLDAEIAAIRARNTMAGAALDDRLREIELLRQAKQAHRGVSEAIEASEQAAKKGASETERVLKSSLSGFFNDIGMKGKDAFQSVWDSAKQGFYRMMADILATKAMEQIKGLLGGDSQSAPTKQVAAGAIMLNAAQLQVQAANAMLIAAGGSPMSSGGGAGAAAKAGMGTYAGIALASAGVGYGIGQATFSTSHGAAGNNARGGLGGAAAGAGIGFMIAGPMGAAVGAVAGFVGGIVGVGKASREAAKQMAEAVKQVALSMDALRATVKGDALAQGIAAIEADRAARAKAIEEAWSGGDANSDRVRWRTQQHKELNALEDERIRQLREEFALQQTRADEDLRVRTLRNQGQAHDADVLAKQLADQREYDAAVKAGRDENYLSLLKWNQGIEQSAVAMNAATASALNMVQGYRTQAVIFAAMAARSVFSGPPEYSGPSWKPVPSQPRTPNAPNAPVPFVIENVTVLDGQVIARSSKKVYKAQAQQKWGDESRWAETN